MRNISLKNKLMPCEIMAWTGIRCGNHSCNKHVLKQHWRVKDIQLSYVYISERLLKLSSTFFI